MTQRTVRFQLLWARLNEVLRAHGPNSSKSVHLLHRWSRWWNFQLRRSMIIYLQRETVKEETDET